MRRDESYIIDLCDALLGESALRQHRFDFLRGDPGRRSKGMRLPVDAYYPNLSLVIEYRERQHVEPIPFMDRRLTLSGFPRGQQRRIYDERRRQELPKHGLRLIELNVASFAHDSRKKLRREHASDLKVLQEYLAAFLPGPTR